jgi:ABC-2 type transport system permease protein
MSSVHNFGALVIFLLKRDRLYLPLWIIGLIALAVFFAPMMPSFAGDGQSAATLTEMLKNPAMVALVGLSYGDGMGAMYAQFMAIWVTLGFAIFNILFVVRHTRKEEERGQNELLIALSVGKNANLLATLLVALATNLIMALGTAVLLPAFGVEGINLQGALIFSLALGAGGLSFAAITALLAQLFSTSRSTNIVAFVLLGLMFMLRAAGDMDSNYEVLALISPLGLVERTQAWVENLIWPVTLLLAASLCIATLTFAFSSARDVGAGLFPDRAGKKHASPLLGNEWGLAWRLTGSMCIGWIIVMYILGTSYGTIINDIGSFMASNELYSAIIGSGQLSPSELVNSFVSYIMMLMAIVSAIPVCMVVFKLKSEERHGHMEQVLAKSVNRNSYMLAYIAIAIGLSICLLLATPLGMYTAAYTTMDTPPDLAVMIQASLNYLPALSILIGSAALLVGLIPKLSPVMWAFLVFCFMIAYMGNIASTMVEGAAKDAFEVMTNISPFSLLPLLPGEGFSATIAGTITAIAIILAIMGSIAYRSRDIKENA